MVMASEVQGKSVPVEEASFEIAGGGGGRARDDFDDDGRVKRTGTLVTASAHIITAVIGSGVLSLAWALAQLGWIAGPTVLLIFSLITWFCSSLLADCYRSPQGKRNYRYKDAVRTHLGGASSKLCALAQYVNLVGVTIGYTITTAISMGAVNRSNCFHRNGHDAECGESSTTNVIVFACIQIVLSQIPNFHKIWWLSIVAAIMSVAYSSIGLGLSIAKIAEGPHARTSLTGVTVGVDVSGSEKVWRTFQALGDIAFAYAYSNVLIEIQDTLRSSPPENQVMKKATTIGVRHHHHVLHAVWGAGIRRVREHRARQLLDRIRLLRSILACRHREYMHRRASHRCLPGFCPTNFPIHRDLEPGPLAG
ncbi:unnamed protein product [Musa textilis]